MKSNYRKAYRAWKNSDDAKMYRDWIAGRIALPVELESVLPPINPRPKTRGKHDSKEEAQTALERVQQWSVLRITNGKKTALHLLPLAEALVWAESTRLKCKIDSFDSKAQAEAFRDRLKKEKKETKD